MTQSHSSPFMTQCSVVTGITAYHLAQREASICYQWTTLISFRKETKNKDFSKSTSDILVSYEWTKIIIDENVNVSAFKIHLSNMSEKNLIDWFIKWGCQKYNTGFSWKKFERHFCLLKALVYLNVPLTWMFKLWVNIATQQALDEFN